MDREEEAVKGTLSEGELLKEITNIKYNHLEFLICLRPVSYFQILKSSILLVIISEKVRFCSFSVSLQTLTRSFQISTYYVVLSHSLSGTKNNYQYLKRLYGHNF